MSVVSEQSWASPASVSHELHRILLRIQDGSIPLTPGPSVPSVKQFCQDLMYLDVHATSPNFFLNLLVRAKLAGPAVSLDVSPAETAVPKKRVRGSKRASPASFASPVKRRVEVPDTQPDDAASKSGVGQTTVQAMEEEDEEEEEATQRPTVSQKCPRGKRKSTARPRVAEEEEEEAPQRPAKRLATRSHTKPTAAASRPKVGQKCPRGSKRPASAPATSYLSDSD